MIRVARQAVLTASGVRAHPLISIQSNNTARFLYRQIHISQRELQEHGSGKSVKPLDSSTAVEPLKPAPKLTLWQKVKHEVQHYWDGTKLLGFEIKVSFKLALKSAAGYELTRRENKQLERTIQDIVRLVPFSMFVIVPFAELLLPVALKLFPNLLPSTYESFSDKEKKSKSLRATREKVSSLLRETVKVQLPTTVTEEQTADFKDFTQKLRLGLEPPSREQTLRVARLFKDDTVLDNLQRPQLVATSRYLNLQPIGTNEMLRFRIRYKLLNIKKDDKSIEYESVDSLTTLELQAACAARGIKVNGVGSSQLNHDLKMWLDLTLKEKIPATLLVLSNAYTYGNLESHESIYDALQAVLSSMPEEVHHVVEADVDTEITNKQRLDLIKEQQDLIHSETKQEEDTGVKIPIKDRINLDDADAEAPKKDEEKEIETSQAKEKKEKESKA
jgi:LETM1 and EF-hand domain-containing protein 1